MKGDRAPNGSLTLRSKDFTMQAQKILKVCSLKLGTVEQGRAQDRRSNRREPRLGCFGSLETLWERSDPSGAGVSSLESQRKGNLGNRFRGLAWDELPLPIAPVVARWGTLECRRCVPMGEEKEAEGEGNSMGCSPEGE